jgi:hypothetical protein
MMDYVPKATRARRPPCAPSCPGLGRLQAACRFATVTRFTPIGSRLVLPIHLLCALQGPARLISTAMWSLAVCFMLRAVCVACVTRVQMD